MISVKSNAYAQKEHSIVVNDKMLMWSDCPKSHQFTP